MGNKNSGPRTRPTAIQKLMGVTRRDRLNPHEPIPPPAPESFDVPPPEILADDNAAAEWSRVVPMLRRIGVVTEAERSALIALCQQWSRYLDAHEQIRADGMVIDTENGPRVSPLITIADKALAHCQKLWVELGLTPSGRTRLKVAQDATTNPEKNKWDGLLQ